MNLKTVCVGWQHKTIQMMYETIYKTLVEVGLEDAFSPQDYLNFFCLGNREADVEEDKNSGAANTPQVLPYDLCSPTKEPKELLNLMDFCNSLFFSLLCSCFVA